MNNNKNYLSALLSGFLFVMLMLGAFTINAQSLRYPASSTTIITPPYSVYLADYFELGTNKLSTTIIYNDFSKASIDVRLRVTIESMSLKIQTRQDFIPSQPINLTPGVPLQVSGTELAEYFNYQNLSFQGTSVADLNTNGRLPEGFYSFCFEILEYQSGKEISIKNCANAWLILQDPPRVISPLCDKQISPVEPQSMVFQWQLVNASSPNSMLGTDYRLSVYELLDKSVDPLSAVNNGKTLLIYESEAISQPVFLYNLNAPQLEVGKTYIYRVQAIDTEGKDLFKNNGYSEYCWFHYGYPDGGQLVLNTPENKKTFTKKEDRFFSWKAPENTLPGQMFKYKLRIVEVNEGQDPSTAMQFNTPWFEEETPVVTGKWSKTLSEKLDPITTYAWQVTAFSGEQQVSQSEVQEFSGPPLIDRFFAGNYEVLVLKTESTDLSNLSGIGKIKISETDSAEVVLKELVIQDLGNYAVLQQGNIFYDFQEEDFINLIPESESNAPAKFRKKQLRLNRDALSISGTIEWPLPHAVVTGEGALVKSEEAWYGFGGYKLLAKAKLAEGNIFDLLDPQNFQLDLNTSSYFLVANNNFSINFNGKMHLPESLTSTEGTRLFIPFSLADQLYYLTNTKVNITNYLAPIGNMAMEVVPKSVIIDLSEDESPSKLTQDPFWKGVYFERFAINYANKIDVTNQLILAENLNYEYELGLANDFKSWVSGQGLQLKFEQLFDGNSASKFNQFKSVLNKLTIDITNGLVSNSEAIGSIQIPVIDDTEKFKYTIPINDEGFQVGYLDTSLSDRSFSFNRYGGENRVDITVRRAVFAENERLDMTLDVEIPYIKVMMSGVHDFRAYGDLGIGFNKRNGAKHLDLQVKGLYDGFDLFIDQIGSSFDGKAYAFSYSATMPLGEEVAGEGGPPRLNVHSVEPLDEDVASTDPYAVYETPDLPPPTNTGDNQPQVLQVDSMYVSVASSIVEFEGYLKLTKDDPKWGTSMQGGINGEIKIPTNIKAGANLILGTKDQLKYWYFDTYFIDTDGAGISIFNMFNLVAMEGKIYRHMSQDMNATGTGPNFIIDPEVKFGAGLYLQMIDPEGGKRFKADVAAEVVVRDNGFIVQLEGDLSMLNSEGRDMNAAAALKKQAASQIAAEAAKEALKAIGDIDIDVSIAGTKVNFKGGPTKGAIGFETGGYDLRFNGDLGTIPGAGLDASKGDDQIKISGDAEANGSLFLKKGSDELDIKIKGKSGGSLDLLYSGAALKTSFDRSGSADFNYEYDGKIIDLAANKLEGTGHINLQFDPTNSIYVFGDKAGRGEFELVFGDNEIKAKANSSEKSGYIKVQVNEDVIEAQANGTEGSGSLLAKIGVTSFEITGSKAGKGLLDYRDGQNVIHLEADKTAGTGGIELQYGSNKKMSGSLDVAGQGMLEVEYDGKYLAVGANKAEGSGLLKLKYDNVAIEAVGNKSEKSGSFKVAVGDDKASASISSDKGAIDLSFANTTITAEALASGSGKFSLGVDGTNIDLGANFNDRSGFFKLNNDVSNFDFKTNLIEKSGELSIEIPEFTGSFVLSPEEKSIGYSYQNLDILAFKKTASTGLNFKIDGTMLSLSKEGSGGVFAYKDNEFDISVSSSGSIAFISPDKTLQVSLANNEVSIMESGIDISNQLSNRGYGTIKINNTASLISDKDGVYFLLNEGGNKYEVGATKSGDGRIVADISGVQYKFSKEGNKLSLSNPVHAFAFEEGTLSYSGTNNYSITVNDNSAELLYNEKEIFFKDNTFSYKDDAGSLSLSEENLRITQGTRVINLNKDQSIDLLNGSEQQLSVSKTTGLALRYGKNEVKLGVDKSMSFTDGKRSFDFKEGLLKLVDGTQSIALEQASSGPKITLKSGEKIAEFSKEKSLLTDGTKSLTIGGDNYFEFDNNGQLFTVAEGMVRLKDSEKEIQYGGGSLLKLTKGDQSLEYTLDNSIILMDKNRSLTLNKDKSFEMSDGTRILTMGGEQLVKYAEGNSTVSLSAKGSDSFGMAYSNSDITVSLETEKFKNATLSAETSFANVSITGDSERNISATLDKSGRSITVTGGANGVSLKDSSGEVTQTAEEANPEYLEGATQAPDMAGPQYIGEKITNGADGKVKGMASLYYNSAESHLIANAAVESVVPPCIKGALSLEATPNTYRIDIGTEQNRVEVYPTCTGFGGGGWLHLTPDALGVGIFAGWKAGGKVEIDFGIGSAGVEANVGAELGVKAAFVLQPSFYIKEAGIWILIYADIWVFYDVGVDSGREKIASASLKGELMVYFESSTRVKGDLEGHVEVIGIGADFDMGFETTL